VADTQSSTADHRTLYAGGSCFGPYRLQVVRVEHYLCDVYVLRVSRDFQVEFQKRQRPCPDVAFFSNVNYMPLPLELDENQLEWIIACCRVNTNYSQFQTCVIHLLESHLLVCFWCQLLGYFY
jgi:hypothetical protein